VQSHICCGEFSSIIWSILQNLRDVLIVVSLSVVVSTYRSTYRNYPVCAARFYWSLCKRSQTFTALVSKSGFLKRGPSPPLGATELFSGGHVQRPRRGHEQTLRPKLDIFIDEQGPQVLSVFW